MIKRFTFQLATDGNNDTINLTPDLTARLRELAPSGEGLLHIFVAGSTAAITTIEYEPGLIKHDLPGIMQKLAPSNGHYEHEATWHDDNGHSHVRSAVLGAGVMVPFADGKLLAGEYQQVILVDFDTRPRRRTLIGTLIL